MATKATVDFWKKEIDVGKDLMKTRSKTWHRLLRRYELDFEGRIRDLPKDEIIKVSRFYPLVRQLIAGIAFNYPRIFLTVEDEAAEQTADLLERAANDAMEIMGLREEIQQVLFDTLFCGVGWLKYGYNPPGDDAEAPYVANDVMREDFPYAARINPMNIYLDPLTPPHQLGHARYIIEKMVVPLEFAQRDSRFAQWRNHLKPMMPEDEDNMLGLMDEQKTPEQEGETARRKSLEQSKSVLLWEVHDRMHRRRLVFADGIDQPIEDIPHPFLKSEPVTIPDPFTGEPRMQTDEDGQPVMQPVGGYLVEQGFPYHAVKLDPSGDEFYPEPPLAYVEDLETLVVESVSRRADWLKRAARLVVLAAAEEDKAPEIKEILRAARDGDVLTMQDPVGGIQTLDFGNLPSDQLGLEADARNYEQETMQVTDFSQSSSSKTATESAIQAGASSLNREWMQAEVARAYEISIRNSLQIMGDLRYTPEQFIINVAPDGAQPLMRALNQADFLFTFHIDVQAGSMQPLIEQLERDDFLQMYQFLVNDPLIDQIELRKQLLQAFRVGDIDALLSDQVNAEAQAAAQMENQWLQLGQLPTPGAVPGQDHATHMQIHQQLPVDPNNPASQGVLTALNQHMAQHQALQQQELAPPQGASVSASGGGPDSILSLSQSVGQQAAQAVKAEAGDPTRG
jgi:hypothetical protein